MLDFSLSVAAAFIGTPANSERFGGFDQQPKAAFSSDHARAERSGRRVDPPAAAAVDLTNDYDLNVRFDPRTGSLSASGTITIVADAPVRHINLLLNKALHVHDLSCAPACWVENVPEATTGGTVLPRTQQLRLTLSSVLAAGDRLRVSFQYSGTITADDIEFGRGIVSPAWSELSLGALWYPVWLDEPMIRSRLAVQLPQGYQLVAPGEVSRLPSGEWRVAVDAPGISRISFAAARGWVVQERPIDERRKALLYTAVPEVRSDAILAAVVDAYNFYRSVLGEPQGKKTSLRVLYANQVAGLKYPREAYATGGSFIVLDESTPDVQRDTIHHEVAHLWFSAGRPGTPNEFLSESVAEYLAMRQGERAWGADWLAKKRKTIADRSARVQGSLLAIDGFTSTRQPLLYNRGPSALWQLHDRIGAEAIALLLSEAHASSISTMSDFINLVASKHGASTGQWFTELL